MFQQFLKTKLKEHKVDVSVYFQYLLGILEDSIDDDEKREMIADIVSSLIVRNQKEDFFVNLFLLKKKKQKFMQDPDQVDSFVHTIFVKWNESQGASASSTSTSQSKAQNGALKKQEEVNLAEMLQTQTRLNEKTKSQRQLTDEERKIKEQILASYSQCSDKEDDDDDEALAGGEDEEDPDLEKNTNKADVQKLAKEKREQARMESAQKKQKDKEDRAKQKANRDEKKEKRKAAAVKGERKR